MKNAVILPYYKAFQQDLGQIYPKNQIFTMARTRKVVFSSACRRGLALMVREEGKQIYIFLAGNPLVPHSSSLKMKIFFWRHTNSRRRRAPIRDKIRWYVFGSIHIIFIFVKFDGEREPSLAGTRARGLGPREEASGADTIDNLKLKVENWKLKTDTERFAREMGNGKGKG